MNDNPSIDDVFNVLDVDNIWGTLWQGACPPGGNVLKDNGFDVLVLAAADHQVSSMYHGIQVICAPGDDDPRLHRFEKFLPTWIAAAHEVADLVRAGKKVLVTCMAGLNRSGFIVALAVHYLTGWPGSKCLAYVRSQRQMSLCNGTFARYIHDNLKSTDQS